MPRKQQKISEDSTKDIKKIARGAGISMFGSIAGRSLWIVCQVIVARSLGPEAFGLYILGLVVAKISVEFARLGLHRGAMRFISIYRMDFPGKVKGTIINATIISFMSSILMGGFVYIFADFISANIFHQTGLSDILKVFAMSIPFLSTMMVVARVSQGFQTTKYSVTMVHIIQPSVNILCVIVSTLLNFGVFGVIISYFFSHALATIIGFYFISVQFPGIKDKMLKPVYETKKLLKYSTPLLVSGLLIVLISWIDVLMLGFIKSPVETGMYRAASQLPLLLLMILNAISSIYAPVIAELHNNNNKKRLEKIVKASTRWIFLLTLPATLILIFSATDIMTIHGSDYVAIGARLLIVLSIAQFINCVTGSVGQNLAMTGKQTIEMLNNIAMVVINIILNYFLILAYGVIGAAIATGISIGVVNLVRLLEVYIIYKIHPYNKSYISGIICGIVSIVLLYILNINMPELSYVMRSISNVLIVSFVFIFPFIIMKLSDEDRLILDAVQKKLKQKTLFSKVLVNKTPNPEN